MTPHKPTLGWAIVLIVLAVLAYHLCVQKKAL